MLATLSASLRCLLCSLWHQTRVLNVFVRFQEMKKRDSTEPSPQTVDVLTWTGRACSASAPSLWSSWRRPGSSSACGSSRSRTWWGGSRSRCARSHSCPRTRGSPHLHWLQNPTMPNDQQKYLIWLSKIMDHLFFFFFKAKQLRFGDSLRCWLFSVKSQHSFWS